MPRKKIIPIEACGNCEHFVLHYRRTSAGKYVPLYCGHCTFPRIKDREAQDTCPRWAAKKSDAHP